MVMMTIMSHLYIIFTVRGSTVMCILSYYYYVPNYHDTFEILRNVSLPNPIPRTLWLELLNLQGKLKSIGMFESLILIILLLSRYSIILYNISELYNFIKPNYVKNMIEIQQQVDSNEILARLSCIFVYFRLRVLRNLS